MWGGGAPSSGEKVEGGRGRGAKLFFPTPNNFFPPILLALAPCGGGRKRRRSSIVLQRAITGWPFRTIGESPASKSVPSQRKRSPLESGRPTRGPNFRTPCPPPLRPPPSLPQPPLAPRVPSSCSSLPPPLAKTHPQSREYLLEMEVGYGSGRNKW